MICIDTFAARAFIVASLSLAGSFGAAAQSTAPVKLGVVSFLSAPARRRSAFPDATGRRF